MLIKKIAIAGLLAVCCGLLLAFNLPEQDKPLGQSIKRGQKIYESYCQACHMEKGEGIEGVFPPLAKSDYLMADVKRAIRQVLQGASGEMTVNGVTYNQEMPAQDLNDQETADVLNYIRNSWGNKSKAVTPAEVKALRGK